MARLRPLPYREVKCRLDSQDLLKLVRKGSHVKFVRRSETTVDAAIVPKKLEVAIGTLRSILSQAHIDPDDWD